MEKHDKLLKEIQDNPTDLNAIVAKRRKDFTGDFFRYLALLSETYDTLEDRDGNYESTWDVYYFDGLCTFVYTKLHGS